MNLNKSQGLLSIGGYWLRPIICCVPIKKHNRVFVVTFLEEAEFAVTLTLSSCSAMARSTDIN